MPEAGTYVREGARFNLYYYDFGWEEMQLYNLKNVTADEMLQAVEAFNQCHQKAVRAGDIVVFDGVPSFITVEVVTYVSKREETVRGKTRQAFDPNTGLPKGRNRSSSGRSSSEGSVADVV